MHINWSFNKEIITISKTSAFVRGQGAIRFKSGAYTLVREHFELGCNAAIGQKIEF